MALRDTSCETPDMDYETDVPCPEPLFACDAARPAALTGVEEQVVALARRDTLASLEAPGLVERTLRLLFGLRGGGRALADARLEALRRAVVVARHRRHLPDAIARDLRERGFSAAQVRTIEARALAAA